MIKMSRKALFDLYQVMCAKGLLYDTINVQVEEQVVIFLYAISHNAKNRVLLHLFGHSSETIGRYFNCVLGSVLKLYPVLLKPPSTITHKRISGNHRSFYPYFKDCIRAIDGSHIPTWVPIAQHQTFHNRKGNISQNILADCDFDMKFTYILSGWEGSTFDSRILDDAIHREGEAKLPVPRGKFYLVDAGFANHKGFLRPNHNVQYHLKEWRNSNVSPADKKELFNLCHSILHNMIERAFGLLKSRFKILKTQPKYPFKTQARIIQACVMIYNHILTQNSVQEEEEWLQQENAVTDENTNEEAEDNDEHSDEDSNVDDEDDNFDQDQFQEEMADYMWNDWMAGADSDEEMHDSSYES
ncbi:putative nuclease HARBI1 [Macadamia integrifolia]|uniref:putative nuclease HARBI1 n=1 Tax=Macadamia integrifolia TaxID=60698 RepID=UPI001C4F325E|nr:putative nuclease HARBI1 [Macadamia integrifolia]XP_042514203.1 putative nuclease HARBI1 [Macadamia integrifolia]XP_042514205.1 putative nuclease HARBI1 [Macadamia integrifolia]XP_042514206.1 putative nuclease HARBI1 [Macadamia integrifolia]XP_042514207.1 putative nuclease HARBI1 [Macadamia integrifolia]